MNMRLYKWALGEPYHFGIQPLAQNLKVQGELLEKV